MAELNQDTILLSSHTAHFIFHYQVEKDIQGGPSGRPLLSVPHILSDESSCYYHGYVLAEMSVHQTRKYFLDKYSNIVDNPEVQNIDASLGCCCSSPAPKRSSRALAQP